MEDQALVAFRGNVYSLPPGHAGELVYVGHRLGATTQSISGSRWAVWRLIPMHVPAAGRGWDDR